MNISGWITFKEVVDSIMLAWGDSSDHGQFMRYLNFAIKGYTDLRLRSLPATKPVKLSIDGEMRVVVLPRDFLKFVSIGVSDDGKFYPFQPKSGMLSAVDAECGVDTRQVDDGYTDAGDVITRYAAYYDLDLENMRILIDGPLALTEVILNYTPTGVKQDGLTYIPRMCMGVIESFVEHQMVLRDKKSTMVDKQLFEREYVKELNKFRGLQYSTDELFNEYYQHIATGKQY